MTDRISVTSVSLCFNCGFETQRHRGHGGRNQNGYLSAMTRIVCGICCLAAIGLGFAPPNVQGWLRATIRDGFQPGVTLAATAQQSAARQLQQRFVGDDARERQSEISNLKFQISNLERCLRREQLARQRSRDQDLLALQRHDADRRPIDPLPLIVPDTSPDTS